MPLRAHALSRRDLRPLVTSPPGQSGTDGRNILLNPTLPLDSTFVRGQNN